MIPEFTPEQKMLQETVRNFAEKEVAPLAYEIDRDERFPNESFRRLAEMGLLGITVPVEYGGAGAGYTDMCIVSEELGAVFRRLGDPFGPVRRQHPAKRQRTAAEEISSSPL